MPEDRLVYFLLDVTAQIDISPIVDDYASENGGQPPFHPWVMLVLLYAYSVGVFSSRKIMRQCETDAALRVIVGKDIPNFRRLAEFRVRHLQHLQPLFLEVLVLCREAGSLKVGRFSLDGTKIKAKCVAEQSDERRSHGSGSQTTAAGNRRVAGSGRSCGYG